MPIASNIDTPVASESDWGFGAAGAASTFTLCSGAGALPGADAGVVLGGDGASAPSATVPARNRAAASIKFGRGSGR